jgi:DNA mismatch repair protein MutS
MAKTTTQQAKLTPMLQQYLGIKERYPQALLFFRMGDFYELFFDDAEVAAKELQIALTARSPNEELKVPMCGVPYHSVDEYLRQLLEKRYKIAICDQVEDPRQAKGLVKREVTRVLTPGTVVEDNSLEAKRSNYLAAVCLDRSGERGGLSWIDYSTGEWSGLSTKRIQEIWQWLLKLNPREILCPEGLTLPEQAGELEPRLTRVPARAYFDHGRAGEKVKRVQNVASLEPLDLENSPELLKACGAVITYLQQTQQSDFSHLDDFKPLDPGRYLILDEVTERNLEIFRRLDGGSGPGTLWHVLDFTETPMGGRLLAKRLRQPWRELRPIQANQEVVDLLVRDGELRRSLGQHLEEMYDLERLSTRISLNRCSPRDLIALKNSLSRLPGLYSLLQDRLEAGQLPDRLAELLQSWDSLEDIASLLERSLVDSPPLLITEGGLFKAGFNADLDELLELSEHGEATLQELLGREREASDLPKLKLGYNRVFGYYFELSKAHKGPVPEHFHRRQTLVNAERYVTDELKRQEEKIFSAADRRKSLEYELFQDLRQEVARAGERIKGMAESVGRIDYWRGLAAAADHWEWCRPELHTGLDVVIEQGRHPAVEASQGRANYIPNDIRLSDSERLLLITGPNMAGKSTVLRQAAIIAILAQIGSFVPATQASLGIADRIFTRVGASDNLAQGQSTFMVEMTETARILRQAGKRSLIVLDEIGRGTSTFDGLSLAWAVVENLSGKGDGGIRTLFATHYHELTDLEGRLPGVRNLNIAVKEWKGDIIFLRKLVPGPADRSYGIEVAKLAGVPRPVLTRAKEILAELEEKSNQLKGADQKRQRRFQSMLPGILEARSSQPEPEPQQVEPQPGPHPLEESLRELDVNNLTPVEALNLISRWKERFSGASGQ